jgi:chromosome segregation ATPase
MDASEKAVEVEAGTKEQSVEVPTVEAEAQAAGQEAAEGEDAAGTEDDATEDAPASDAEIAEADALRARLSAVEADKAQLTVRVTKLESDNTDAVSEIARIVGELKATTEALKTVTTERDELRLKIAAVEKGAPPVSAAPAKEGGELTPWQKAQKAQKR